MRIPSSSPTCWPKSKEHRLASEWGVTLDQHGMPCATGASPSVEFNLSTHLNQPMPKRQRAWWARLDALRAARLSEGAGRRAARRLHSCGGAEGGAYLRATRAEMGSTLTDNEFVYATRFRLGMRVMAPGVCHHQKGGEQAKTRTACLAPTAPDGEHAVTCKCGGAPNGAHSQGCNFL